MDWAEYEKAKTFWRNEGESNSVMLSLYADYARDIERALNADNRKAYDEAEINYYAIRAIIEERMKGALTCTL